MNFQIVSDIHIERDSSNQIDIVKSDPNIIIAGDLGNIQDFKRYTNFLIAICKLYDNVFLVPGNNEFYTNELYTYYYLNAKLDQFCRTIPNLFYLNGKCIEFEGIRIYGTILWSNIPDEHKFEQFLPIKDDRGKPVTSDWINMMHKSSLEDLINHIKPEDNKKLLIISHYAPTFKNTLTSDHLVSRKRFFYSNHLDHLLTDKNIHTWVYGHTHVNSDFISEGGTRVVSNQYRGKGYINSKIITV
jgi:predicted phosphodiesterase